MIGKWRFYVLNTTIRAENDKKLISCLRLFLPGTSALSNNAILTYVSGWHGKFIKQLFEFHAKGPYIFRFDE